MTTIYALASAKGRAGVAVMRLSGADAGMALATLTGKLCATRAAGGALCTFADPTTGVVIDRGLAIWFPAPASFTGEDVAELHLHGGPAVIAAMAAALDGLGLLPAEPGEFSRRAFEHGKLDLTEAEGIADLVNAETEAQRVQAVADGRRSWRACLRRLARRTGPGAGVPRSRPGFSR